MQTGAYIEGNGDIGYIVDNVMLEPKERFFLECIRAGRSIVPVLSAKACKRRGRRAIRRLGHAHSVL